jgi:hypothetical protein
VNPQLSALFAAHKTAILGAAGVGVVGLALLQKKKGAAATPATTGVAGTIPAAAVVPASSSGSGPNNSAYDVYSALQSELAPLLQQQAAATGTGGITTAPAPIASSLFSANRTGNYVAQTNNDGVQGVFEVESDGSLYHLSSADWTGINSNGRVPYSELPKNIGAPFYGLEGNLTAANKGTGPTAFTTNDAGFVIPYSPKS